MKIAIEGMDGVGKSTIAKELAKRNEFTYIGDAIHKMLTAKMMLQVQILHLIYN